VQDGIVGLVAEVELGATAAAYMAWLLPVFVPAIKCNNSTSSSSSSHGSSRKDKETQELAYDGFQKACSVIHAILSLRVAPPSAQEVQQVVTATGSGQHSSGDKVSRSMAYVNSVASREQASGAVVSDLIRHDQARGLPGEASLPAHASFPAAFAEAPVVCKPPCSSSRHHRLDQSAAALVYAHVMHINSEVGFPQTPFFACWPAIHLCKACCQPVPCMSHTTALMSV
jgi:hypothetical protein